MDRVSGSQLQDRVRYHEGAVKMGNSQDIPPNNAHFRTSFTGENEWYTPIEYTDAAKKVMGDVDLDPATSVFGQTRVMAKDFFTAEDDGLQHPWGGRVWLNPPYAQPLIAQFAEKAVTEYREDRISEVIILTHNYTDTSWFHLIESMATHICFTRGRVKFEKEDGTIAAPTQGSAFFYLGQNSEKFREVFGKYGFIR
jgi:phage N-6-adenine-methyltransferase